MGRARRLGVLPAATLLAVLQACPAAGAPKPDLWALWEKNDPSSTLSVDHGPWSRFLATYVETSHPSGIHLVRYGSVTGEDRAALERYLRDLQGVTVSMLDRSEQRAFWINIYNALTVKLVLDHYPVESIRDIDISPGLFADGPWDARLLTVEGEEVSLNDIEHRILRPIWKDSRLHYAVNCASLGCPNLQERAFTASNAEELLEKGAREYVNHPRGARFEGNSLTVSSIYKWFRVDFGGSEKGVISHLLTYAEEPLTGRLRQHRGRIRDSYDWDLNESR